MVSLGSTSDIIVAALLAVSQLIEPVPESAIEKATQAVQERNSCGAYEEQQKLYEQKRCERLKSNRRRYRSECQPIESEMNKLEVQCATDPNIEAVLRFRPKPLESYFSYSNRELVHELNVICGAVQDRIFLDREEWEKGVTSNRDDIASKLVVLQKPELQDMAAKVLKEAADGDIQITQVYQVAMALCHWKVDRDAVAKQFDFRGGLKYLKNLMSELPDVDRLPEQQQASFVFDDKGRQIGEIYDQEFLTRNGKRYLKKVHRRRVVEPNQIPKRLFDAFIAIEDKRFREHNGFDFETVKRVYYGGMQGETQGGSTFTMQLVKNAFFDDDVEEERALGLRTIRRKLKEVLMLPMVEKTYTKDEILTYYLNLIDLTPRAQGVFMASQDLFAKEDLHSLNIEEVALLAALPKGTSRYNPRRNPVRAKLRRDTVIRVLQEQGYISVAEKDAAQAKPMKLADQVDEARVHARFFTGHLTNYFSVLKAKNLRDERWAKGGFDIKTSLNLELQKLVSESLQQGLLNYEKGTPRPGSGRSRYQWKPWTDGDGNNVSIAEEISGEEPITIVEALDELRVAHPYPETGWLIAAKIPSGQWALENGESVAVAGDDYSIYQRLKNYDVVLLESKEDGSYKLSSGTDVQGAAIMMDIQTGEVLALSGGFTAGAYGKFAQNNRATRSLRQPGSTVKPFTYLYALNKGVQPNQLLSNYPVRFPKIDECPYHWTPKNYSDRTPMHMPVRYALENSVNRFMMNLFVDVSGVPANKSSFTDLSGVSSSDKRKLSDSLYGIYDLASELGAFPKRSEIKDMGKKPICFPFLLGGWETTPLNMAQAYAAIANGGLRREAIFLKEVVKEDMPLVIDQTSQKWWQIQQYRNALKQGFAHAPEAFGAIRGLDPVAVTQLRSILQGVVERGTAARMKRWSHLVAGKTGTTNGNQDAWFAGFNNQVAVVIWVGYDSTREYPDLGANRTGGSVAVPIFESIMEGFYELHPEALEDAFPGPSEVPGVVHMKVDRYSGKIYKPGNDLTCSQAPSSSVDEYFSSQHTGISLENSCQISNSVN